MKRKQNEYLYHKVLNQEGKIKLFKKIIHLIRFGIWYFIIRPIKKFYHLCIKGSYIPDNERNQEVYNYCIKIVQDNNYQPSTPVENWCENNWRKLHKEFMDEHGTEYAEAVGMNIDEITYESWRPVIAQRVLIEFNEYNFIKER